MSRLLYLVALIVVVSVNGFSQINFSAFDPTRSWKKVETKYFEIYYSETSQKTAMRLYTIADEVYEVLSRKINVEFSYKFPVVVVNQSDLPNGFYSPIPWPFIVIYTSRIGILDEFAFDDDIKGIFAHELTHALAIEEANGIFWKVLRFIFGYYIVPNIYLPGVFIESVTTFNESTWGYGRVNDPVFRDKILSEVYYGKFRYFSKANLVNEFPYDGWYLYGGMFFDYLARKYGYDKTQKFYKENSYYLPLFYHLSFYNTFQSDLGKEWSEFESYLKTNLSLRGFTNNFSRLTTEGGYKDDIKVYKDFLIYSQRRCKGELNSLKYLNLKTGRRGFLIYGRSIKKFDVKDDTIAFIEVVSSKYYTKTILKVGRILDNNDTISLVEEVNTAIEGVYDVSIVSRDRIIALVDYDTESRVVEINSSYKSRNLIVSDKVFYRIIEANGSLIALAEREDGRDKIRLLNSNLDTIAVITNFDLIYGLSIEGQGVLFSASHGQKVDVFYYNLNDKSITRVVSSLFSFTYPVRYNDKILGISLSEVGFDVFETKTIVENFNPEPRELIKYNIEVKDVKTFTTNVSPEGYSYLNKITLLSALMTFFPSLAFNPDFSVRKLGVYFNFYDEPLEFRSFYVEFTWNFNARTIDYDLSFKESGIPYIILDFRVFRDNIDTNFNLTQRLNSRNYNYDIFTFDYFRFRITGSFGDNYITLYPFISFSLPSYNGRMDFEVLFPEYRFVDSQQGFVSPYFTVGFTIDGAYASVGSVAPFEEGFVFNMNSKIASKDFDSQEDILVLNNSLFYAFRLWANNVVRFGINLRNALISSLDGVFYYDGYFFEEIFPVEEGSISTIDLSTYARYVDSANNFLSSEVRFYLKFFEINEGVWPIFFTSVWSEFGARGGVLFDSLDYVMNRSIASEVFGGLFFSPNFIGIIDNKVGVETVYNLLDGKVSMNIYVNLQLGM
ncbi:MAG: hypothetical protein RMJ37_03400 [Spirochaetia bacterium]|nr:hypothetical protein [Spirochaetota bacterium]MDW8112373.1 hypothetical protein [Spirochaetia bacterium]